MLLVAPAYLVSKLQLMSELEIDYPAMIDRAMRDVVRQALKQIEKDGGLPGEHHFFISFDTNHPDVSMSDRLREKYPSEMTIVLQHQYWNLDVTDIGFSVELSFNNTPEEMKVPYEALTAFADPSIKFGLQFHLSGTELETALQAAEDGEDPGSLSLDLGGTDGKDNRHSADVISLDQFRKK